MNSVANFLMSNKKKFGTFFGILLLGLAGLAIEARSPDLDLYFVRNIPTSISPDRLEKNISSVARWPQWFFSLAKVTIVDSPRLKLASSRATDFVNDPSLIEKGSILKLEIDSHRLMSKPFVLTAEVTAYQPLHILRLSILEDSSGRLTRLFDRIEWQLDFQPVSEFNSNSNSKFNGKSMIIHAQEWAHTRHWKSRFFGRVAERVLMNQVYYPDIIKLSELKYPFAVDEGTKTKGGFGTASD
jgi:hypothetical protein